MKHKKEENLSLGSLSQKRGHKIAFMSCVVRALPTFHFMFSHPELTQDHVLQAHMW